MQTETLNLIDKVLTNAGIPYAFQMYNAKVSEVKEYWVGEYQEVEPLYEDGAEETSFIITGTANSYGILEESKKKIKELFPSIDGMVAALENGSVAAIFYANSFQIPSNDARNKRIQINLKVKEFTKGA